MRKYKATALNDEGFTFQFSFQNENWNGIEEKASLVLEGIVANDATHQKNGPWKATHIDVYA